MGKAKEEWGDLTDDEKAELEGKLEQVHGKGQQKVGEAQEELDKAKKDVKRDLDKERDAA
jgi:uncharacterized protein YjbJ (UPF0337 family)